MPLRRLTIALAPCALLAACAPDDTPTPAPRPARTELRIAYDPIFAEAAGALERRYELDRPGVDVLLETREPSADADVLLVQDQAPPYALELERRIGVIVPEGAGLRLIDLSRGTCDVIIGREGTPLGELGRRTLRDRGLDDSINPRLREADADDLIDRVVAREGVGLAFEATARERAGEVRIVAQGAAEPSWIVASSAEGDAFVEWLVGGITTRALLREYGFDVPSRSLRIAPDQPQ